MKIHILYQFKAGPYGGVNQFLKALKDVLERKGCYEEDINKADIVLYNSSNATREVLAAKAVNSSLIFVQRMDGPTSLYTMSKDSRDAIAYRMNKVIADATIFQTEFSKNANIDMGLHRNKFEVTIPNAPNEKIFYCKDSNDLVKDRKVRLIASSWSSNVHKGFETYKYLDDKLDFDKYEMFFVGNSPFEFKNIKVIGAMASEELADMLRSCDIYITASRKDPCSNSLIEAMFCGLPVLALRDGGHPELVGEAGELFDDYREIPALLDKICNQYDTYRDKMVLKNIEEIGNRYYSFMTDIYETAQKGEYYSKKNTLYGQLSMKWLLFRISLSDKLKRMLSK